MKLITIKKGKHFSNEFRPKFYWYTPTKIKSTFYFLSSCKYDLKGLDQLDINKLFGIGIGLNHHKNSIRVGWRYCLFMKQIELYAYDYNDKDRNTKSLGFYSILDRLEIEIRLNWKQNFYRVFINNIEKANIQYDFPSKYNIKTKLGFYFGGTSVAPHTIKINKL